MTGSNLSETEDSRNHGKLTRASPYGPRRRAAGTLASVLPCNTCDREDERFEEIGGQSWGGAGVGEGGLLAASVSGCEQESGVIQLWLLSSSLPSCTSRLLVTNSDLAFANHLNGSNP